MFTVPEYPEIRIFSFHEMFQVGRDIWRSPRSTPCSSRATYSQLTRTYLDSFLIDKDFKLKIEVFIVKINLLLRKLRL